MRREALVVSVGLYEGSTSACSSRVSQAKVDIERARAPPDEPPTVSVRTREAARALAVCFAWMTGTI